MKMEPQWLKSSECCKNCSKRSLGLPQKNKNLKKSNFTCNGTRKRMT